MAVDSGSVVPMPLQARDPFTQFAPNATTGRFIPSDKWNQYGGTIGGPILKNKLFFFGDYQGTKETTGVTNELTVPTLKAEQTCTAATGFCDLSDYLTSAIGGGGQVYLPNVTQKEPPPALRFRAI